MKKPVLTFEHATYGGNPVSKWWRDKLDLSLLRQNLSAPQRDRSYKEAFEGLDMQALRRDIEKLLTDSQPWWPADWGHYGPFFIRMAWHSAGTYRIVDGRGGGFGGDQRFDPVGSWPDNANLDKARRLLWPIKRKYGEAISWGDLMILAANVAMESMGFQTLGFAGGREDVFEGKRDIDWGPETTWLEDKRRDEKGEIKGPFGAVQMGLIYVNPEGPNGEPNVLEAAKEIKRAFRRMGMEDEETVALIAGGHTFGKCHGAASSKYLDREPGGAKIEEQGLGWRNRYGKGNAQDAITSGLEGAWTPTPTRWDMSFLETLFKYEWSLEKSPAGAWQWVPTDPDSETLVPDAHIKGKTHKPIMLTTDLALRMDPEFGEISKRFLQNPKAFEEAFAKAWFKLTHRDMGPKARYLGDEIPKEDFIWQDPLPKPSDPLGKEDVDWLKRAIKQSAVDDRDRMYVAWSAASTYRDTDKRGGVNGARIALDPQCNWEANEPATLANVLESYRKIQSDFNAVRGGEVSLADLIVLGGNVGLESAIERAGFLVQVPFRSGRVDATQAQTDVRAFGYLEPVADGFRNYVNSRYEIPYAERALIDKAHMLSLNVWEMTVLVGGMRALGLNHDSHRHSVLFEETGVLDQRFFVSLLDMGVVWRKDEKNEGLYVGIDRSSGRSLYSATRVDLIFGHHDELRAYAEFYAQEDNKERFVRDFVSAWTKVMELDRFDLE